MDHAISYVEKIHSIDAELVGHAYKLDIELQRLCGNGFSLFAVRILAKPEMVILHDAILKMVILQDAIKNSE